MLSKKFFLAVAIVSSVVISPLLSLAASWSEPLQSPPLGNADTPLNVGSSAQTKTGALTVSTAGSGVAGVGLMVGSNTLVLQASQNLIYGNIDSSSVAGANLLLLQNENVAKFVVSKDGNVGIGTATPNYRLTIKEPGDVSALFIGDDKAFEMYAYMGVNTVSEYFKIQANKGGVGQRNIALQPDGGNVGIGTTNPGAKLEVSGQVKITGGAPGAGKVLTSDASGLGSWQTPAGFSETDTLQTVTTRGATTNLGITTAGLALNGSGNENSVTNIAFLVGYNDLFLRGNSAETAPIYYGASDQHFYTAGTERLTILNNGNVGVGTANPGSKLEVNGNILAYQSGVTNSNLVLQNSITGNSAGLGIQQDGVNSYLYNNSNGLMQFATNGTARMTILNNGNIGIGTAGPEATLSVSGTMSISPTGSNYNEGIRIHPSSSNDYSGIFLGAVPGMTGSGVGQWSLLRYPVSSNYSFGIRYNNEPDYFNISNTGQVSIPNLTVENLIATGNSSFAGNVGIGTTNPGAKLQIDTPSIGNGEVRINASGGESSMGFYTSGDDWISGVGGWGNTSKFVIGSFTSNPGPKLILDTSGNLSIPSNLYLGTGVSGQTSSPSYINLGANYSNGTTRDKLKIFLYNAGGIEQYGFGVGNAGDVQYHSNTYHDFYISNSLKFRIDSGGIRGPIFVNGTGNTNPGSSLRSYDADVNSIGVSSYGNQYDFLADGPGVDYGSASSIRWKNNIKPIDNALDKILKLRGVYFNWNKDRGGKYDIGMIAEEVGKVVPEIVSYEPNGKDAIGMDYGRLTPLLVDAIKELEIKNKNLENRLKLLEEKLK